MKRKQKSTSRIAERKDAGAFLPQFSIAVPVGAWHPFLPAALESLASQVPQPEIALLDASGDRRVVEAADASGLEFAYRRHGPDAGQSDAIAEGWAHTTAPVLGWLNADDRLTEGALTAAATAFEADPDLAVFFGESEFTDETGAITGRHENVAPLSNLLFRSNTISQPSCFAKRDWIERVGGINQSLHYTMDWDLWLRLYLAGAKFEHSDLILSQVFMGPGTKTNQVNLTRLGEVWRLVASHSGWIPGAVSTLSVILHPFRRRMPSAGARCII